MCPPQSFRAATPGTRPSSLPFPPWSLGATTWARWKRLRTAGATATRTAANAAAFAGLTAILTSSRTTSRTCRSRVHLGPRVGPFDAQLILGPAVRLLQLRDLRGRSGQHVQRRTAEPSPAPARARRPPSGVPDQPPDRRHARHDLSPDHVCRVREDRPRAGREARAAHARQVQRSLPRAAGSLLCPDFALDDELSLECFRIPHFYRAFYVYKYATGMSAAIALADRVLHGGPAELAQYLLPQGRLLERSVDLLRAGVDMSQPGPNLRPSTSSANWWKNSTR